MTLGAFTDENYGSKATDISSVSGGAIMCRGVCVSLFSRTEEYVTLSTTKTEYIAMGEAVKELSFLRQLW